MEHPRESGEIKSPSQPTKLIFAANAHKRPVYISRAHTRTRITPAPLISSSRALCARARADYFCALLARDCAAPRSICSGNNPRPHEGAETQFFLFFFFNKNSMRSDAPGGHGIDSFSPPEWPEFSVPVKCDINIVVGWIARIFKLECARRKG